MNKAVFLDRDGTINIEKEYLWRKEDFVFLPGVIEALKKLKAAGFLLIVVTNQSGIARGYYTEEAVQKLHEWMKFELECQGVELDDIYYCPHHPEGKIKKYRKKCICRKPGIGMYLQAAIEHKIDFSRSYAIGDKIRDCSICELTDCRGFLIDQNVLSEKKQEVQDRFLGRVQYAKNLSECVKIICEE